MDHHHHLFGFMESSHFYASLCSLVGLHYTIQKHKYSVVQNVKSAHYHLF